MVEAPRSSFIPREAPGMMPGKVRRKRSFALFDIIATGLLIGSLALSGFAYAMKVSVQGKKQALEKQVNVQNISNTNAILEIEQFHNRLKTAESLMANHISPLKILTALELNTKEKVQYQTFSMEYTPGSDPFLQLGGVTKEFRILALQAIDYESEKASLLNDLLVTEVQSGNIESDDGSSDGGVTFSVEGYIKQSDVRYDGAHPLYATPLGQTTVPEQSVGTSGGVESSAQTQAEVSGLGSATTTVPNAQSVTP